jgi:hypothetical protein
MPDRHRARDVQEEGEGPEQHESSREIANRVGAAMGLLRDRLDKDINLYATNLEKMAQAVELMAETVAAERRKRERQQQEATEAPTEIAAEAAQSAG